MLFLILDLDCQYPIKYIIFGIEIFDQVPASNTFENVLAHLHVHVAAK